MKKYKYKSYDEYTKCQIAANKKKSSNVWAKEENIKFLAEYLAPFNPTHGICHGTRGGHEQEWFNKYINNCYVIGTEIGDIAALHTVRWDFNKVNGRWLNKFDFVYSNSFDHAYNPEITLNVWSNQLKPGGLIILEYDKRQEHTGEISMKVNKTDPISITVDELIKVIPKWNHHLGVIDVITMPVVTQVWRKSVIIKVS
jgi:hypothetical protein